MTDERKDGMAQSPESSTAVARMPTEAFLLFDRQDDQAVISRIRGAALKEYVYAFKGNNILDSPGPAQQDSGSR